MSCFRRTGRLTQYYVVEAFLEHVIDYKWPYNAQKLNQSCYLEIFLKKKSIFLDNGIFKQTWTDSILPLP